MPHTFPTDFFVIWLRAAKLQRQPMPHHIALAAIVSALRTHGLVVPSDALYISSIKCDVPLSARAVDVTHFI